MDSKAYTQISYIIENMSEDLRKKIPKDFIDMIEKNKDKTYELKVKDIEEMELFEDTEKILSVMYTDYIASEEEKMIIRNKERLINFKKEENKKKKYDINVFGKR